MKEIDARKTEERNEIKHYSDYILEEDNLRSMLEEEASKENQEFLKSMQMDNLKRAEEVKEKKKIDDLMDKEEKLNEVLLAISDPFLSEETNFSKVRPDHFKGFSKDQIKYIFRENDAVLAEKKRLKKKAEEVSKQWDTHQDAILQEMEKAEFERQLKVKHENQVQVKTLKIQRQLLREKQAQMKKEKFGAIEEGFFQKFGQSCR